MRNRSRPPRPPRNVVQFRGYRPKPTVRLRPRTSRVQQFLVVIVGLAIGGGLGWGAHWYLGQHQTQVASPLAAAALPSLCIADVHDGDTIRTCAGERIRIANIDAPELRDSPKCTDRRRNGWCDYELAQESRDALASFLASGGVAVSRSGTDKYGRTLATLAVRGQDAGEHLIQLGLAKPWI